MTTAVRTNWEVNLQTKTLLMLEVLYMWMMTSFVVKKLDLCFPFPFFFYLIWYQYHVDCTHRNVKIFEIPFEVVETFDDMMVEKMWKL